MPLSVAMALSGVEPEHWGDGLRHFYMQGAAALHKPRRRSLSMSSASSAVSTESGISSMSSRSDQSSSTVSDWHAVYNELVEKLEVLVGTQDRQQQEDTNVSACSFLSPLPRCLKIIFVNLIVFALLHKNFNTVEFQYC